MRLGRRLISGIAEDPPAPSPVGAVVDSETPREPDLPEVAALPEVRDPAVAGSVREPR